MVFENIPPPLHTRVSQNIMNFEIQQKTLPWKQNKIKEVAKQWKKHYPQTRNIPNIAECESNDDDEV